jgi:hypothetical protein
MSLIFQMVFLATALLVFSFAARADSADGPQTISQLQDVRVNLASIKRLPGKNLNASSPPCSKARVQCERAWERKPGR